MVGFMLACTWWGLVTNTAYDYQ